MMGQKASKREALLEMIKEEQATSGHMPRGAMVRVSEALGVTLGDVYGVTTFYSFLSTSPVGRHVIRVCKSVPCCMKDAEVLIEWLEKELGIRPGETTPDGRFTLTRTNCIGACDQAPAMLIGDEVHGQLTPERLAGILKSFD
ncbi:MAG: NADH-quinone oxidoreductase subunit NuoE [Deltaproteobacteria bacterium]